MHEMVLINHNHKYKKLYTYTPS